MSATRSIRRIADQAVEDGFSVAFDRYFRTVADQHPRGRNRLRIFIAAMRAHAESLERTEDREDGGWCAGRAAKAERRLAKSVLSRRAAIRLVVDNTAH